jgi:integrase
MPVPPRVIAALLVTCEGRGEGPWLLWPRWDTGELEPMDRHCAGRIVTRLGKAAGIDHRVSPHQGRVSAITGALDSGASLRRVQSFARHADPRMTTKYDRGAASLDDHAAYVVAGWWSGAESTRAPGSDVA